MRDPLSSTVHRRYGEVSLHVASPRPRIARATARAAPEELRVQRHARGFCVRLPDVRSPLSVHWTLADAITLAQSLARRSGARVVVCDESDG